MHLLIRRSQRDDGWITSSIMFLLDVRLGFTPDELQLASKYQFLELPVYDSDDRIAHLQAAFQHYNAAATPATPPAPWYDVTWQALFTDLSNALSSTSSFLYGLGNEIMTAFDLHITYADLLDGQHIECENLDSILTAEQAITQSCELLALQLGCAVTFDGREELLEF